jgi:hypothetical protein
MNHLKTNRLRWAAGIALMTLTVLPSAGAGWPKRVFAPYMFLGADDNFQLTQCADVSGQKYYTLAFIIANKARQPTWYGRVPMESNLYAGQIDAIRARGGDVIVSFGGADGKELALVVTNAEALQAEYQGIIDRYHFTWLDFDIEGKALHNIAANERRNIALAGLQAANPGLIISYTLPVDPDGIPKDSQALLIGARDQGVKVHSANVMTMDFGRDFSDGKKMSDVSIASALKAYEQCQAIDPQIKIGLTPDIGQNDVKTEVFSLADAKALMDWGKKKPWVCSVSFWCSNRDSGDPKAWDHGSGVPQTPWAFTKAFQKFSRPGWWKRHFG